MVVLVEVVEVGFMALVFSFRFAPNLVTQLWLAGIGLIRVIILLPQLVILTFMDHDLPQILVMAHFLKMCGQGYPHLQGMYQISPLLLVPSLLTQCQLPLHLGFQTLGLLFMSQMIPRISNKWLRLKALIKSSSEMAKVCKFTPHALVFSLSPLILTHYHISQYFTYPYYYWKSNEC